VLNDDNVNALLKRAQREIDQGLLPSCQLALAQDGKVVVHETFGDATNENRYVMFSATKPVVAGAVWMLIQEGKLDVSRPVAEYVPEFGTNGKEVITVEQVMLHTSGFPHAPLGAPEWASRETRVRRFGEWRLNWEPGTAFEYHPTSAHWVLAELIERLAGVDYRRFIAERITGPLEIPRLQVGVPAAEQGDSVPLALCGEPLTPDELEAALGIRELPVTEVTDEALVGFNDPAVREVGVPGGGGITRAAELALYYQALLHNTGGLWDAELLADVTSRVRQNYPDKMLGTPAMRSLGLVIAGDDGQSFMRGMGRTVSPRAFGHNGAAGQIAWGDPATGLSFAYLTNGIDRNIIRQYRRGTAVASLAADCASPGGSGR
jgi:CubicO group peptidase (beta-lactamase class C family)